MTRYEERPNLTDLLNTLEKESTERLHISETRQGPILQRRYSFKSNQGVIHSFTGNYSHSSFLEDPVLEKHRRKVQRVTERTDTPVVHGRVHAEESETYHIFTPNLVNLNPTERGEMKRQNYEHWLHTALNSGRPAEITHQRTENGIRVEVASGDHYVHVIDENLYTLEQTLRWLKPLTT